MLFSLLCPAQVIQVMNSLLLEKSLVVICADSGTASVVATACSFLIQPFRWEGVLIPLLPTGAEEVLHAPVPYILGVDKLKKDELPFAKSTMVLQLEYIPPDTTARCLHPPPTESTWNNQPDSSLPVKVTLRPPVDLRDGEELPLHTDLRERLDALPVTELRALFRASSGLTSFLLDTATRMSALSKERITDISRAIALYNTQLLGDLRGPGAEWQRYGTYDKATGDYSFKSDWFMNPKFAWVNFQNKVASSQLFVSYVDRLRVGYLKKEPYR